MNLSPELIGTLVIVWIGGVCFVVWGIKIIRDPIRVRKSAFLKYLVSIPLRNAPLTDNLIQSQGFSWVLGGIILILLGIWYVWG